MVFPQPQCKPLTEETNKELNVRLGLKQPLIPERLHKQLENPKISVGN